MPLLNVNASTGLTVSWQINSQCERVWRCLIDATLLAEWLGHVTTGRIDCGGSFAVDHGEGNVCQSVVKELVVQSRLSYSWEFPGEPATTVQFDLRQHGAGVTDVLVTHSGLGDLADEYRAGWCAHLVFLEACALGAPMPPAMFWPVHATIAQLGQHS